MIFAKRVFLVAGVYGLLLLPPQYFLEDRLGRDYPPPITHPEHYYGFLGVAIAWQLAFLVIARDPQRYRLMMLPAVAEKFSFGLAAIALFLAQRVPGAVLGFGVADLTFGLLFIMAFRRTAVVPA
jgi:hypothetical protein